MPERPLYDCLDELRAARDDLKRSSYQTFDGIFARYVNLLKPGTPIGDLLESILPTVDFDSFWSAAVATMGGMVGSGQLAFLGDKRERVAMERALLLRMGEGEPDIHHVTYRFFHHGSSPIGHRQDFVAQVVEPFHRDVASLLNPYLQDEKQPTSPALPRTFSGTPSEPRAYVDSDRVARLRAFEGRVPWDLRKLIRLLEELNLANGNRAWHSVAFLTRTILNHVAPALGYPTFAQVAAHASPKHYKIAAQSLEEFGRTVADFHLHEPMGEHLALASEAQVSMVQQLDIVLSELERILSKEAIKPSLP